jgi:predicted glutamine amidotransferase
MCGLVGIAGNLGLSDEMFMKRLLVLDYFRGTDSTGLAAVRGKGDVSVVKRATHPLNLFDSKEFTKALNGCQSVAFIGHNRAATVGKVNDLSAHPYEFGDVVGAHNGTLTAANWNDLERELEFDTVTDSAAIFACLDKFGIDHTLSLLEKGRLSQTGAWALTWYDSRDGKVRLLRNEHRPLWICFNKERTKVAWASEWPMLEAAVNFTDSWEMWADEDGYGFFEAEEDMLYEFDVEKLISGLTPEQVKACAVRKVKGKEAPKAVTVASGQPPFLPKPSTTHGQGATTTNARGGTNVVEMSATEDKPFCNVISEERFNALAQNGCSWCGTKLDIDDEGLLIYDEDDVILCSDCSPKVKEHVTIYATQSKVANWSK